MTNKNLMIKCEFGTFYLSAWNAALALNCSNSTIMNKLKEKNSKILKGRYLIKGK